LGRGEDIIFSTESQNRPEYFFLWKKVTTFAPQWFSVSPVGRKLIGNAVRIGNSNRCCMYPPACHKLHAGRKVLGTMPLALRRREGPKTGTSQKTCLCHMDFIGLRSTGGIFVDALLWGAFCPRVSSAVNSKVLNADSHALQTHCISIVVGHHFDGNSPRSERFVAR
jgi:hypothetical protein